MPAALLLPPSAASAKTDLLIEEPGDAPSLALVSMPPKVRPDLGSHKRARVDISSVGGSAPSELPSPIDTRFFDSKMMDSCKRDFQSAKPFPHLRLTKFCEEKRMRAIREEITGRLHAKFKETDLYKVKRKPICTRFPALAHHASHVFANASRSTGEPNRRPDCHRRSACEATTGAAAAVQPEVRPRATRKRCW